MCRISWLFGPIQLYSGGPTGGSGGGATPAANNNPCSNATLSAAGVNVQQQIATAQGYIAAGRIGANATPYANPGLGFFGGMYVITAPLKLAGRTTSRTYRGIVVEIQSMSMLEILASVLPAHMAPAFANLLPD